MDVSHIPEGGAFILREKRASGTLLGGVLVLGAGNLLVKLIGLVFKIPLSRLLGDEGMGYFNTGYTVYSWLFLIGCTGFPVAVSMLVSEAAEQGEEEGRGARRILFVSLLFLFLFGFLGCLFLFAFRDRVAAWIGNPGSAETIGAIAPAVLFCFLSGGVRGYFQGKKRMGPTAVSQLTEAGLKLVLGIAFAKAALDAGKDLPAVAASSIRGVTVGCAASTVFLFIELLFERNGTPIKIKGKEREGTRSLSQRLLSIALPITFSATIVSLTGLIDLVFVMRRLVSSGYELPLANAVFGNYTTLSVPFFNLPSILIAPIATGIVPFLSGDIARGNFEKADQRCRTAIRAALVLSFPAAFALGVFGGRILSLFFAQSSVILAAPSLSVLSPGIVFLSLVTVSSAILQARGKAGITVFSMLLGSVVKMIVGYILIGIPSIGVNGAAIGTVLCYAVAGLINLIALSRSFHAPLEPGALIRPALPTFLSFALGYLVLRVFPDRTSVFATVLFLSVAGFLYFPLSLLFGSVTRSDVEEIPVLRKIFARSSVREEA